MALIEQIKELDRLTAIYTDAAENVRAHCTKHNFPLPPGVSHLYEESVAPKKPVTKKPRTIIASHPPVTVSKPLIQGKLNIPSMPNYGPVPLVAGADWVPVPVLEASIINLVIFALNELGGTASSIAIERRLRMLRRDMGSSSVHMALNALIKEGRVIGTSKAWQLRGVIGATLQGNRVWSPPDNLRSFDRSAIRREAVIAALEVNPHLTVAKIEECLKQCDWLKVPITQDLIKADMRTLKKTGKARKEGVKWMLSAS